MRYFDTAAIIRPLYEDLEKMASGCGAIVCSCNQHLFNFEQLRDHWQRGHFDRPANCELREVR